MSWMKGNESPGPCVASVDVDKLMVTKPSIAVAPRFGPGYKPSPKTTSRKPKKLGKQEHQK
jgi:hypothetical protein